MHAAVVTGPFRPEQVDAAIGLYQQMVPTVRQFQGHQGLLALVDRAGASAIVVNLYGSDADAQRVESSGQYQEVIGRFRDVLAGQPTREVYEVAIHDLRGQARYARVTQAEVPPGQLEDQSVGQQMAEAASRQPGYAGFLLLADRAGNRVLGMSLWDSLESLEASEQGYYQRGMAEAAGQFVGQPRRGVYEVAVQA